VGTDLIQEWLRLEWAVRLFGRQNEFNKEKKMNIDDSANSTFGSPGLLIHPHSDRVVRFALLPDVKPILLPGENDLFSVALLAVEYTNANPASGNYDKGPTTDKLPPTEWRVGYVKLSLYEFWRLCRLAEDGNYDELYGYDLVMRAWFKPRPAEFYIKSKNARWRSDPAIATAVGEAAQRLVPGLVERVAREAGVKATAKTWKLLVERAQPQAWRVEGVDEPYPLALIDRAAEDFPGLGERCRQILGGARASETLLMDDATAFMQVDYLSHGADALRDPYGNEPAAAFFLDTHWNEGIQVIEKFADDHSLRRSTACAVLMTSIARIIRIDLKGVEAGNAELKASYWFRKR
jgi:hypothetical protein